MSNSTPSNVERKLQSDVDKMKAELGKVTALATAAQSSNNKKQKNNNKKQKKQNKKNTNDQTNILPVSTFSRTASLLNTEFRRSSQKPFEYGSAKELKWERSLTLTGNTSATALNAPAVLGNGQPNSISSSFFLPINAGNQSMFPQLSNVSPNFNVFEFFDLVVSYVPDASLMAATNQTGQIIIAYCPDPLDNFCDDPVTMSAFEHVQGASWEPHVMRIPGKYLRGARFVDVGGLPTGADVHSYFSGVVQIGSWSNSGTGTIGFIEFGYHCAIDEPIQRNLNVHGNSVIPTYQSVQMVLTASSAVQTSGATYSIDGNNMSMLNVINLAGIIKPTSPGTITFNVPEGNYLIYGNINIFCSGANDFFTAVTVTVFNGATSQTVYKYAATGSGATYQSGPRIDSIPFFSHLFVQPGGIGVKVAQITVQVTASTSLSGTWVCGGLGDSTYTRIGVMPLF